MLGNQERQEVMQICSGQFYRMVLFSEVCRTSSDGESDAIKGPPADDPTEPTSQDECGRFYPWGFDARQPSGTFVATIAHLGGSQTCIVGGKHPSHGPDYDDAGWSVCLHNEVPGTTVQLRTDGSIAVVPAAGQQVRIGSNQPAEVDPVVLFTQLKAEFDAFVAKFNSHAHVITPAGVMQPPAVPATPLSSSCASVNVLVKKP